MILQLFESLPYKGPYCAVVDNLFTEVKLAKEAKKREFGMLGTAKADSEYDPQDLTTRSAATEQHDRSLIKQTVIEDEVLCTTWQD